MGFKNIIKKLPLLAVALGLSTGGLLFQNQQITSVKADSSSNFLSVGEEASEITEGTYVLTYNDGTYDYYLNLENFVLSGDINNARSNLPLVKCDNFKSVPEISLLTLAYNSSRSTYTINYTLSNGSKIYFCLDSGFLRLEASVFNSIPDYSGIKMKNGTTNGKFRLNFDFSDRYISAYTDSKTGEVKLGTNIPDSETINYQNYEFSFRRARKMIGNYYQQIETNGTDLNGRTFILGATGRHNNMKFLYDKNVTNSAKSLYLDDMEGSFISDDHINKEYSEVTFISVPGGASNEYFLRVADGKYLAFRTIDNIESLLYTDNPERKVQITVENDGNIIFYMIDVADDYLVHYNVFFTAWTSDHHTEDTYFGVTDSLEYNTVYGFDAVIRLFEKKDKFEEDNFNIRMSLISSYCDPTGKVNNVNSTSWINLQNTYGSLSDNGKNALINATYSLTRSGSKTIVTATGSTTQFTAESVARYDYIVNKYGYENFIGRTIPTSGMNTPLENVDLPLISIILVGITLSAFGLIILMKK